VLISGPTSVLPPLNVQLVRIQTAEEMKQSVLREFPNADYVIMAAAVSDFRPERALPNKKKKSGQPEELTLVPTEDILALLSEKKENQILVGFCAETENLEQNARLKLEKKKLDMIVANRVGGPHDPFGSDENEALILDRLGNQEHLGIRKKAQLAGNIWDEII